MLAALESQGWALPNNCRAGTCGECKVKVRAGTFDQGFVLDMALSEEERRAGYGAMCMAKPLSDVLEIEWGTADAKPLLFPPQSQVPFTLVDRIRRTPSIQELVFAPESNSLRFWPGQHIMIGDRDHPPRSYSIAHAPKPDGEIHLYITEERFGMTSHWLTQELAVGVTLLIDGPYGSFIGDPSIDTPVLLLAGGSGLAPLLSLTDAALGRGFEHPVELILSARTEEDVYPKGSLAHLCRRYPNFTFTRTLTGAHGPNPRGRIPTILAKMYPDLSQHSVFIAGSVGFVESCERAVLALGCPSSALYTEPFTDQDAGGGSLSLLG